MSKAIKFDWTSNAPRGILLSDSEEDEDHLASQRHNSQLRTYLSGSITRSLSSQQILKQSDDIPLIGGEVRSGASKNISHNEFGQISSLNVWSLNDKLKSQSRKIQILISENTFLTEKVGKLENSLSKLEKSYKASMSNLQSENRFLQLKMTKVFKHLGLEDDIAPVEPVKSTKSKLKSKRFSQQPLEQTQNKIEGLEQRIDRKNLISPSFQINLGNNGQVDFNKSEDHIYKVKYGIDAVNNTQNILNKTSTHRFDFKTKSNQNSFLWSENEIESQVLQMKNIVQSSWNVSPCDSSFPKEVKLSFPHNAISSKNKNTEIHEMFGKFEKKLQNSSRNKENISEFASVRIDINSWDKDVLNNTTAQGIFTSHRNVGDVYNSIKINPQDRSKSRKKWFD